MNNDWYKKIVEEGTVTTDPVKILICQAQDSKCPKCGKIICRQGFTTKEETIFACGQGHDFTVWHVPPKELVLPECDLVGLLNAWGFGGISECRKVVRTGSMLSVADKDSKGAPTQ
jgi:hypothetical protein